YSKELRKRLRITNKQFLVSRRYREELLHTMTENGEHPGYEHARLRDVSPRVRRTHRPFALVRNPWSRVVSRFTFAQHTMGNGASHPEYAAKEFEAFLEERHIWGGKPYY